MPTYWEFMYRPRRDGESQEDRLLRKLSFKLPVVVRYNLIFPIFFGVFAAFYTKKSSTVLYFYRFAPIGIAGLCYEEIIQFYKIKMDIPFEEKQGMSTMDLIRSQEGKVKKSSYYWWYHTKYY